jgi:hypothetical protein
MVSRCGIDVPTDPASLNGPPIERPTDLIPWGPEHVRGLPHSHRWQFSPKNRSADGWAAAIRASQFGNCSRLLLIEDDLTRAGLGFTAKIWQAALLVAMRDNRVLMEVRMVKQNMTGAHLNYTRKDLFERPRWCDREPFTLQCMYMPWTHCPLPPPGARVVRPGGRPLKVHKWPHEEPYVVTGLGRIHRQGLFWHGARSSATREAGRFLFRPRQWVQSIAECVMQENGLSAGNFINVHIRHSVEKQEEGKRLGVALPTLPAYGSMSVAMANDLGTRKVFVQTASPEGLAHFGNVCREHKLELSYTNNSRSENDAWGGWKGGLEMEQATVAAVNAHIGSLAALSASPVLSLWTNFLWFSYGSDGRLPGRTHLFCEPSLRKRKGQSHIFEVHAAASALQVGQLKATRTACSEGHVSLGDEDR